MATRSRSSGAVVLGAMATLCAACGDDRPLTAAQPSLRVAAAAEAPEQPFSSQEFTPSRVELAEVVETKDGAAQQRTGRLLVRIESPEAVPLYVDVSIVAAEPRRFRELGADGRLLDDELDQDSFGWNPLRQPQLDGEELTAEVRDGHFFIDVMLEDLPLARELWLCVYSQWEHGWAGYRAFPPVVRKLAAIDGDEPLRVEPVLLCPRGGVAGRVVDRAWLPMRPVGEIDDESGESDEVEDPDDGLSDLAVHDVGGIEDCVWNSADAFELSPLKSGPHQIEISAASERAPGVLYRALRSAVVRDGAVADLGLIEFGLEPPRLRIHAVGEDGQEVEGSARVHTSSTLRLDIETDEHGEFALAGDWRDLKRIDFTAYPWDEYLPVSMTVDMRVARELTILVHRRVEHLTEMEVFARAPDGTCAGLPICFARKLGSATWSGVSVSGIGCGGGVCSFGPLEPGAYEVAAWCRPSGLSCRQVIDVPTFDSSTKPLFELYCMGATTKVSGELRVLYGGEPYSRKTILAGIELPGCAMDDRTTRLWGMQIELEPGHFELAGLPTDLDLVLRLVDSTDDETFGERAFRLDAGQQLDLGVVEIDVR